MRAKQSYSKMIVRFLKTKNKKFLNQEQEIYKNKQAKKRLLV